MEDQTRIALLIDCDNASHRAVKGVLKELAKYGTVTVRHGHGDWTQGNLSGWKKQIQPHAIKPIQQFAYVKSKNATDAAMIIDAMDLLYGKDIDAIALMTSDSDFTPLALRLREDGLIVHGFGEQKTPQPFVDACCFFDHTEKLTLGSAENRSAASQSTQSESNAIPSKPDVDPETANLLLDAVEQTKQDNGWANLADVGQYISSRGKKSLVKQSGRKLEDLIHSTGLFDIDKKSTNSGSQVVYAKKKPDPDEGE